MVLAWGSDFLVLRHYHPLDHHSRFSIGRISKLPVGAAVLQSEEHSLISAYPVVGVMMR
jgi:hypothetical protein